MKKFGIFVLLAAILFVATASGADFQEEIRWLDFRQGLARSKQTGQLLMIYFYSEKFKII